MKKFVIIILLILPIFLMVTVSLVGQMLANITYIKVESVAFVDELEEDIDSVKVEIGETLQLKIKILPELAYNKKVKYTCIDSSVATISNSGEVTGLVYGFTTVIVESLDGGKQDKITIHVTNEKVANIDIHLNQKDLYVYGTYKLDYVIYPSTAVDKKVFWTSSNPDYVSVDASGVITAHKTTAPGQTITITAITRDGEKSDTCVVRVLEELLSFVPQSTGNTLYTSNTLEIDLATFVVYDSTKITFEDIGFEIEGGDQYARIENGKLIFNQEYEGVPFKLHATVDNGVVSVDTLIFLRYISI